MTKKKITKVLICEIAIGLILGLATGMSLIYVSYVHCEVCKNMEKVIND